MKPEILEKLKKLKELIKEIIKECEDEEENPQTKSDDTVNPDPKPPRP